MLLNAGEPVAPGVLPSGAAMGAADADFGALRRAANSARCSGVSAATSESRSTVLAPVRAFGAGGAGRATGAGGGATAPSESASAHSPLPPGSAPSHGPDRCASASLNPASHRGVLHAVVRRDGFREVGGNTPQPVPPAARHMANAGDLLQLLECDARAVATQWLHAVTLAPRPPSACLIQRSDARAGKPVVVSNLTCTPSCLVVGKVAT